MDLNWSNNSQLKFGLILANDGYRTDLPSLGIGYVAASISRFLPEVKLIIKEDLHDVLMAKPDLIGISAMTDTYSTAIRWAEAIKATINIPVILGGIHISLIPQSLKKCFDVAVIGEGEITIVELLQSILCSGGKIDCTVLETISGLAFYKYGRVFLTPRRAIVKNIDSLALPNQMQLPHFKKGGNTHVFSARGCPYECSFCASSSFFQKYRSHSVKTIIDQISFLINDAGSKFITFFDDLFIASVPRLRQIIEELEARQLLGCCQFMGHVRSNLINDEVCLLLKRLGMTCVSMGLESFSDKILNYYNKAGVNSLVNQRALDLLAKHNITVLSLFMFGAPSETADDVHQTLEHIFRNLEMGKIQDGQWGLLAPYPGTRIWDYAKNRGIVSDNMDWDDFTPKKRSKLYLDELLPQSELLEIIQEWRVKFTLLGRASNITSFTNLYINDQAELEQSIDRLGHKKKPAVSRHRDDLILGAHRIINKIFESDPVTARVNQLVDKGRNHGQPVAIYGAGVIGRKVIDACLTRTLEINGWFDSDPVKAGTKYRGFLCKMASEVVERSEVVFIVASFQFASDITERIFKEFSAAGMITPKIIVP